MEFRQGFPDELDPPVAAPGQGLQDVAVEDEGAPHPARRLQRVVEGGVVVIA